MNVKHSHRKAGFAQVGGATVGSGRHLSDDTEDRGEVWRGSGNSSQELTQVR